MKAHVAFFTLVDWMLASASPARAQDGSVLPFPPAPMTGKAAPRLQDATMTWPEQPHDDPGYHLTEDLVDKALAWLDNHQAFAPDKPFLMYWPPGAVHGPHHIFPEWADKYKGKFDDGWDAYRERIYKRQLEMGIISPGTRLTQKACSSSPVNRSGER